MKFFSSFQSSEMIKGLRDRWFSLANSEKKWMGLALVVVLSAAFWQLLLAPSIATLRSASVQGRLLDAELARMRVLQLNAIVLQKQPIQKYDEALRALTTATQQALGASAKLEVIGDRVSVTLQDSSSDGLAQWLSDARASAKAVPVEARLTRSPLPGASRWSGLVVMSLTPR
jgi:general secretion pathway protein M